MLSVDANSRDMSCEAQRRDLALKTQNGMQNLNTQAFTSKGSENQASPSLGKEKQDSTSQW